MNARNPLVSIVIPVYNGANYLREAIDSALAQTYPDIEIIVVNDGSNDDGKTRDVALSFGNRIRYFERTNGGVAAAMNLGIHEMNGRFVSWLSHDDAYYPEKISRQVAYIETQDDTKTIVFSNYHIIDHTARIIGAGAIEECALDNSILSIVGTYVNGCSALIPKDAFETAGLFNESLRNSQDNELWLRMAMKGYRFQYLPDILIKSRKHAEQGSLTTSVRHAQEARAFYLWALMFMGRQHRVQNAVALFRILLTKRSPSAAVKLFRMLTEDQSLRFALSSMVSAAVPLVKVAIARRLTAVPAMRGLLGAVQRRRFRSSSRYWERRYQMGATSGAGSFGRYAEYKADVLNEFAAAQQISKVAEFGCGDGNQVKRFRFTRYLGLDISPTAIEKCREMYADDQSKTFLVDTGPETMATVRSFGPELTISLDVIYHLVEDEVFEAYMRNLFDVSSRYVIIYSTNFDRRYDFPHQVDRKFSDYVARNMSGWRLLRVLSNPNKGGDTQSDFYIYQKVEDAVS